MHTPPLNSEHVYFFRIFRNGIESPRTLGLAFSSDEEAWHEASTATGEILRDIDGKMQPGLDWRMDVSNAAGDLVYRFSFKAEEIISRIS